MTSIIQNIPTVPFNYFQNCSSTRVNQVGIIPMQERPFSKKGEQYLLIKSPPASGKSGASMFIALDKLQNQKIRKSIVIVPESSMGVLLHECC